MNIKQLNKKKLQKMSSLELNDTSQKVLNLANSYTVCKKTKRKIQNILRNCSLIRAERLALELIEYYING